MSTVNEAFFDEWSPAMAWVLGYIYADGCHTGHGLHMGSIDKNLLENVRQAMNSDHAITFSAASGVYNLQIQRKSLMSRLESLGVTPRKTWTLTFPQMPSAVVWHFIRGYFDGDGHLQVVQSTASEVMRFRIVSATPDFLEEMRRIADLPATIQPHGSTHILQYGDRVSHLFGRNLYRDSTADIRLDRKFNKYMAHVAHCPIERLMDRVDVLKLGNALSPERVEAILDLHDAGLNRNQIAERLNLPHSKPYNILKRLGIA